MRASTAATGMTPEMQDSSMLEEMSMAKTRETLMRSWMPETPAR